MGGGGGERGRERGGEWRGRERGEICAGGGAERELETSEVRGDISLCPELEASELETSEVRGDK